MNQRMERPGSGAAVGRQAETLRPGDRVLTTVFETEPSE